MHEGTVSNRLAAAVLTALGTAEADSRRFACLPDLAPEALGNDLCRVSTPTMLALWEQLTLDGRGTSIGANVGISIPMGGLGVWDHLFGAGESLIESLPRALAYLPLAGDPGAERVVVIHDGGHFTLQHTSRQEMPDVVDAIEFFALAIYLGRVRGAARRPIDPVRVAFRHRAPKDVQVLHTAFGTRAIDFGAEHTAITFLDRDVRAPLPPTLPGLGQILEQHADLTLAAAKPVLCWIDAFRVALAGAAERDSVTLADVAARLALSTRTLQRRLAENQTTWREELDAVRARRELHLLQDSDLTIASVAARVGYSDLRAYRRAVQRRHGDLPSSLRSIEAP
ncbi:AraC-like DNA-binding protein [Catenulispora sp. EB89]|uniref:helix-turn-helix transcriptional regulator n=1 Tax=Catenulispora sp. EB89 TaxID=3156257 RepID=UPI003511ABAA